MGIQLFWTLLGAILGAILSHLPSIIKSIRYRLSKKEPHYLEGEWFGYFSIHKNGKEIIGREIFNLKRAKNQERELDISIKSEDYNQSYIGRAVLEEGRYLVMNYQPKTHEESIFVRLKKKIAGNSDYMIGLWSALNYDGFASVGPMLLSRKEIKNLDDVKIKFENEIELSPNNLIMKLKK